MNRLANHGLHGFHEHGTANVVGFVRFLVLWSAHGVTALRLASWCAMASR